MSLRKVLLLTYHFPPSGAVAVYRMLGLVRYLPSFGWQPLVVAPPQVPWEPSDPTLLAQVPPDMPIERVPFADGLAAKVVRRIAPEAHWILKARPACRRMIEKHRPEAVITSSPPGVVHLLGRWVHRRFGLPWIACFRDPWAVNRFFTRVTLGMSVTMRVEDWLEARVMDDADRAIANTPANLEGWRQVYPQHAGKMVTITNGFDPDRFAALPAAKPPGERIRMLHAGELYDGRDPRPFLDAIQQLQAEPDGPKMDIEFVGRSTERVFDLAAEISKRGLGGVVRTHGQVPYGESLQKMAQADILMLFQTPRQNFGIPAKVYEYLGARRPVLAMAEPGGDIPWILGQSKVLHRVAAPLDVVQIKQAVREIIADVRARLPAQPDPTAVLQFTRERMAERFAECLDAVAPQPSAKTPAPAVTP